MTLCKMCNLTDDSGVFDYDVDLALLLCSTANSITHVCTSPSFKYRSHLVCSGLCSAKVAATINGNTTSTSA